MHTLLHVPSLSVKNGSQLTIVLWMNYVLYVGPYHSYLQGINTF